jgi:preprotein translocase subunit SecD
VWRPAGEGATAAAGAYLGSEDAATDTARAVSAASAKPKATAQQARAAAGKPTVRRRNAAGNTPQKPGSSR